MHIKYNQTYILGRSLISQDFLCSTLLFSVTGYVGCLVIMNVESDQEFLFKIVFVGDSGVGKTAFITRYCDGHFDPVFIQTVGIDFKQTVVTR